VVSATEGVCHCLLTAVSVSATPRPWRIPALSASSARAVGQDEQAFAPVAGAGFGRCEYSARNAEAHCFQWRDEGGELPVRIPWDVLAEDNSRPHFLDDAQDLVDEESVVVGALSLASGAVRLARVARSEDIHASAPRQAVEGCEIVPDRCRIQGRVFHPRHERGRRTGFPLDVTHSSITGFGDLHSEVEAAGSGT
jgi:hypothetical protein